MSLKCYFIENGCFILKKFYSRDFIKSFDLARLIKRTDIKTREQEYNINI